MKRTILTLLLLAGLLPSISLGITKYPDDAASDWSDQWCTVDNGTQNVVKPGIGDVGEITVNSGVVTITVAETVNCRGIKVNPGVGDNTLVISNDSTIVTGSKGIEFWDDVSFGTGITISSTDIFFCTRPVTNNPSVTLTGAGDFLLVGNATSNPDIDIQGVYTIQVAVYCADLTCSTGIGSLDFDSLTLTCTSITAIGGTFSMDLDAGTLDINGDGVLTGITFTDSKTGSADAVIECTGSFVLTTALPDGVSVTLNDTGFVSADASANRADLIIDTAGIGHVANADGYWDSITMTQGMFDWAGYALDLDEGISGTAGTIDVATTTLTLGGTFNGANITITGSAIGGLPATIEGGTIQNVDASGYAHVDARGIGGSQPADGGGNNHVRFVRGIVGGGVF